MKSRPEVRTRPGIWDALVALAVLLLAVGTALFLWRGSEGTAMTARIFVEGEVREEVPLSRLRGEEERTLSANGYTLTLRLFPEGVQVTASDCPTQDCVHTGEITRPGQSIVCLPARISVQLQGTAADGVDAMLG